MLCSPVLRLTGGNHATAADATATVTENATVATPTGANKDRGELRANQGGAPRHGLEDPRVGRKRLLSDAVQGIENRRQRWESAGEHALGEDPGLTLTLGFLESRFAHN